jgi:hypothetical protein
VNGIEDHRDATKCALFTSVDHKAYNDIPNYDLDRVTKFWMKKNKMHNTYNQSQAIFANEYKSAVYAVPQTSSVGSIGNNDET